MKNKFFSPKVLTIGGLCLLSVAVLVGVLFWKSAPAPTFTPEADTSVGTNDEWVNSSSLPTQGTTSSSANGQQTPTDTANQPDDTYQVVAESQDEVVINMTPPAEKPEAPDAPDGKSKPEGNAVPDTPAEDGECIPVNPEKPKPQEPSQPGKVNDPVFGWTEVPSASGQPADSDGDPDKIIGNMG